MDMDAWATILDEAGARAMTHHQIWQWLAVGGRLAEGMPREAIVITYEQLIGRREVGQSCYGDYCAAVTRTRPLEALPASALCGADLESRPKLPAVVATS